MVSDHQVPQCLKLGEVSQARRIIDSRLLKSISLPMFIPPNLTNMFSYFHKAHPYALPRYYFINRLDTDPDSLKHLFPVLQYIGSLYAPDTRSSSLRTQVLSLLDSPNLPQSGYTVLALLLTAIAVTAEDDVDLGRSILDRAINLALHLRMDSRTFANMERDSVVGESWRRTYWGLYITDSMVARIRRQDRFL